MAVVRKLEDVDAWQQAISLTVEIYQLTSEGLWASDFGLRDQIRRASVSVSSNIAEGYGRKTRREFARFLDIARGSALEVKSLLITAWKIGYLAEDRFRRLSSMLREVTAKITALANYLRQ